MAQEKKSTIKLMVEVAAYSSAAVFIPIIIFGGAGFFLDKKFGWGSRAVFVGLAIAFIITNIFLVLKAKKVSLNSIDKIIPEEDDEKNEK